MKKKAVKTDIFETPISVLSYRRSLNILNYIVVLFFSIAFILFVVSIVGFFRVHDNSHHMAMSLIINAGFFGLISSLIFSLWRYHVQAMLKSKLKIFETSLVYSDPQKEYSIYFEDIKIIETVTFMGLTRIMLKTKEDEIFIYSSWINHVEQLLDQIYKYDKSLIGDFRFEEVRRRIIFAGHNLNRLESLFSSNKITMTLLHVVLIPFLTFLAILWKQSEFHTYSKLEYYLSTMQPILFVVVVTAGLYFIAANTLVTSFMVKFKSKNFAEVSRNQKLEDGIYKKIYPWYLGSLLVLLFVVYTSDVNVVDLVRVKHSSVPMNMVKGERIWIDKRYNCNNCKFSLKNDDIVAYVDKERNEKFFAEVVELTPDSSRLPASVIDHRKVLVIKTSINGEEKIIPFSQVLGKKF